LFCIPWRRRESREPGAAQPAPAPPSNAAGQSAKGSA
jgi:hypothetical protein